MTVLKLLLKFNALTYFFLFRLLADPSSSDTTFRTNPVRRCDRGHTFNVGDDTSDCLRCIQDAEFEHSLSVDRARRSGDSIVHQPTASSSVNPNDSPTTVQPSAAVPSDMVCLTLHLSR